MRIKKITLYLFFILVFDLTVRGLLEIGKILHLSYKEVNVIIWYMLLPLLWAAILDHKLHQVLFAPIWLMLCLGCIVVQHKRLYGFCNTLFRLSQEFILSFGMYYLWSVIICLLVPIGITTILLLC